MPISSSEFDLQALRFRCIGPPRGGRVLAVHGHPTETMTFYFGACAGGIWKTEDGGTYWRNISDGHLRSAAVGALAVSEADPNVIYAGMGESTLRLDVSYGDGIYRSTDGGTSWQHAGLSATHHISEIRVHPRDPALVYVAALGHGFGPNPERGVYRSRDGGESWELVLHKSPVAGAADLTMDPNNPRVLFASMYQVRRTFWNLESGGPDSGLWKSDDGGDTWVDITRNQGLPKGMLGKIGVSVSPAWPRRVWALVEATGDEAGLYRSDDGGGTWKQISTNRDLMHRAWYYMHVFADPCERDTVYITNLKMWKSTDGGVTFAEITTPHGDNHDLWIDPHDPRRMVEGNDGGACVSLNGGASWSTIYNQNTAQFYHLAVDGQTPYRVYGTQQDNSSISVPSACEQGGIPWSASYLAGTGESGYIAVHPRDPNIVYVGAIGSSPGGGNALQRYDHRTKQIRLITVWPEVYYGVGGKDMKYRFSWTYPIVFSPHDPNVLYVAGNHVFRTSDAGQSFEVISPDLSRGDPSTIEAPGGPINLDTSGAEIYATVYAFAESPHEAGTFWAGTDDGLVQLSRDAGGSWVEVTPPDLPEWALISMIEVSPHDTATVYLAATRYKIDDYAPYLYKTEDFGHTWKKLDAFPPGEITRCVRVDPHQPGLLYVGSETGIFVSLDDGGSWQRLEGGLPVVPVYDLIVKDADLVVGTHGRSFWILDDVTPLRELAAGAQTQEPTLFTPRPTLRHWISWFASAFRGPGKNYMMGLGNAMTFTEARNEHGELVREMLDAGENPPHGVIVYYHLPAGAEQPVTLTFLDADGNELNRYGAKPEHDDGDPVARYVRTESGLNRFVWPMRLPNCEKAIGDPVMLRATTGPVVPPGTYRVRLTVGELVQTRSFDIHVDPKVEASTADLQAQFALWKQIHDKLDQTHHAINRIRRVRKEIEDAEARAAALASDDASVAEAAALAKTGLDAIEEALIQTGTYSAADRVRLPARLNVKLSTLCAVVSSCDAAPTKQSYEVFEHLRAQTDDQLERLEALLAEDVAGFAAMVAAKVPAVVIG